MELYSQSITIPRRTFSSSGHVPVTTERSVLYPTFKPAHRDGGVDIVTHRGVERILAQPKPV